MTVQTSSFQNKSICSWETKETVCRMYEKYKGAEIRKKKYNLSWILFFILKSRLDVDLTTSMSQSFLFCEGVGRRGCWVVEMYTVGYFWITETQSGMFQL